MMDPLQLNVPPIWHPGERAIQQNLGIAERMEEVGRQVIRPFMPDQHRAFYAQLPFIVAGSVDGGGDAWATLLVGRPGFITSPSPTTLDLQVRPDATDPAGAGLHEGDAVGLLGLELHTRRRNRANGRLRVPEPGRLHFELDQSFGNCPKYIQLRDYRFVRDPAVPFAGEVFESMELDAVARTMIATADTFFVASYVDDADHRQVDVSHRGGRPGFVRIDDDGTLTIPDFVGNMFFSTLGNILVNGKAGLLFVDFETGDMLQLSGDAEVILDSPEIAELSGAERLWKFRTRRLVRRPAALPLRWSFHEDGWSPFALRTGDWPQRP